MTPSFLIDNWSREGVDGIVKSGTVPKDPPKGGFLTLNV